VLQTISDLRHMTIGATDGEIGRVRDAYFDDHAWAVRYLVVDPGPWLAGRWVQITPWSIRGVDWENKRIDVALTREQVRNSPAIDADPPVSRQHEIAYLDYYGYPHYWSGPLLWGELPFPDPKALAEVARLESDRPIAWGDPHLRSASEVQGYHIEARDGPIGHVDDFVVDDQSWLLRYLVVDTRNWLPGRHVLLATEWVREVNWQAGNAHVALTRDEVRASPEYDRRSLTQSAAQALHPPNSKPGRSQQETR
jgi:sporulation protein YlmC with PRC-barrel domain